MENSQRTSLILLVGVVAVLVILGVIGYAVVATVRDTTQSTLGPVGEIAGNLSTQVSEVLNPTPTILPDPITIVRDVRTLSRLETIQYSLEKVITAESGQGPFGFLFGDRLLFVAHGQVIAGVDLAKMEAEDMWLADGVLFVRLPAAEVFVAALDNEKSYVYDREVGVLTRGDVDLETAARRAAEDEILDAALEDGILEQAQTNAENYMFRLLRDLGFPEVVFVDPLSGDGE